MNGISPPDQKDFVRAFLQAHRSLFAYVVALSPNLTDAEEIFQKTSLILWEKWTEFDQSRDFLPWAFGIARLQVRRHLSRDGRMKEMLGEDASKVVAEAVERVSQTADSRLEALQRCLQKLTPRQQNLLKRCYEDRSSSTLQEIADEMKIAAGTLYQRLRRLRGFLHECVERTLLLEEPG